MEVCSVVVSPLLAIVSVVGEGVCVCVCVCVCVRARTPTDTVDLVHPDNGQCHGKASLALTDAPGAAGWRAWRQPWQPDHVTTTTKPGTDGG